MKELGNGRNRHPYRPHPVLSVLTFHCLSFAGGPSYVKAEGAVLKMDTQH